MRLSRVSAFKLGAAVLLAGLTAGCALPPAIAIASYAIDAGSFIATGKTATDHGISAVAQQDCAVLRIFEGPICIDEPDYQLADSGVLSPLPSDDQFAGPMPITPLAVVGSDQPIAKPMPITPLLASDTAGVPQISALPDVRHGGFGSYDKSRTITRDSLLSGAGYLAEGLSYAAVGNES